MTGAERCRDASGLKDHSVIFLIIDYVFQQGSAASAQVMTMSQGSDRSVTIHITGGTIAQPRVTRPIRIGRRITPTVRSL